MPEFPEPAKWVSKSWPFPRSEVRRRAARRYEQAIERDPAYALARIAPAETLIVLIIME